MLLEFWEILKCEVFTYRYGDVALVLLLILGFQE
jgi:hypothetical protein